MAPVHKHTSCMSVTAALTEWHHFTCCDWKTPNKNVNNQQSNVTFIAWNLHNCSHKPAKNLSRIYWSAAAAVMCVRACVCVLGFTGLALRISWTLWLGGCCCTETRWVKVAVMASVCSSNPQTCQDSSSHPHPTPPQTLWKMSVSRPIFFVKAIN